MKKFVVFLLSLLLGCLGLCGQKTLEETGQSLQQLRQQLQDARKRSEELSRQEKSILEQLQQLDKEAALQKKALKALQTETETVNQKIAFYSHTKDSLQIAIGFEQKKLGQQMRNRFKAGRKKQISFLFSATSFSDFFRRWIFLRRLTEYYTANIITMENLQQDARQAQAKLEEQRDYLQQLIEVKNEELAHHQQNQKQRKQFLANVHNEKKQSEQAVAEIKSSIKAMEALYARLEKEAEERARKRQQQNQPAVVFSGDGQLREASKGKLPWPAKGKIKRKFGKVQHPQFKTYILNNGIDIEVKVGTHVKAVADGEVVFSDWMAGYGMLIILDHGNGFHTSYSHNSELLVAVGDIIKQSQVIAYSGNTGSVMGPLLHFEFRRDGKAENPLLWLQK